MENTNLFAKWIPNGGYLRGDLNDDGYVTDADAVYLLKYIYFAEYYPVNQSVDFNNDGNVTDKDAIHLLFHIFFPEVYSIG